MIPALIPLAMKWLGVNRWLVIAGAAALALAAASWFLIAMNNRAWERGAAHERQKAIEAQDVESKITKENREKINAMPPDDRTRLMRCIRERVREGRASPDCERLLQGLRTGPAGR